jgi:ribosomal-protein-alanine N-acetyltransferase
VGASLARGPRVHLRHPGRRDREEFLAAVARSRRLHGRWVAPPADDEAYAAYQRRLRRADAHGFLVCRNDDGALAGAITISRIVPDPFRSGYLGYYAFEPHAGHGLMREALDLTVRFAFGELGLHRLEANVQPGNARSIALARRCGFRLEGFSPRYLKVAGRWRDHERWAITVEDRRMA